MSTKSIFSSVLLVGCLIFFTPDAKAQSGYNDYRALDKVFKLREDFNTSSQRWETGVKGKSEAEIINGALIFSSINDRAQAKYIGVDKMDWSGDWELELGARWINGKDNSSVDFIWDRTPGQTRKYHFGFTAARKYNIAEYNNGYQQIVSFTQADFVYRTTRNRMTIRHVAGFYYFFVNERFVKKSRAKAITGDHIGFMTPPGTTIAVDYLYARQLKSKSSSYASSNSSTNRSDSRSEGYFGVMTKNNGYTQQRWKTRDNFPKEEIKSDWNDGYSISDLSYDNNKWTLVMSKGTGFSTQNWITRREWNREDIKAKWDEGYLITEASYGNGVYAIVFSKTDALGRQKWATKISGFPSDKIREFGKEGLKITKVFYGKDRWVLVGTKDSRIKNQKWFKRSKFPAEDIETYTVQGYSITQLSQEDGWWVLVMSQYYKGDQPNVWFRDAAFPKAEIKKYWDQGYYLTDLTYSYPDNRPAPQEVTTSNQPSKNQVKSTAADRRWEKMNLQDYLIGTWYGGAPDETDKGYLIFNRYRDLTMINKKDTIGGPGYTMSGVDIELKYELNSFNTPNQLDWVFYSDGKEYARIKGIIRRTGPDEFKFKLAPGIGEPRPSSFTTTKGSKITVFKRQR